MTTIIGLLFGEASASAKTSQLPPGPTKDQAPSRALAARVRGEVIVKFRRGINDEQAGRAAAAAGSRLKKGLLEPRAWIVAVPKRKTPAEVAQILAADSQVVYAEPNGFVQASYTPNDPLYLSRYQWNFGQIHMSKAWNYSRGGGVVVAVVDTGVGYENYADGLGRYMRLPDFNGTRFTAGYDFINGDSHANDDNGHGSHVAGTIAQATNNGAGLTGIAHRSTIMPVKVLDSAGFGTYDSVADGIRWAANNGARVINLSLGSSSPSSIMKDAVNYARLKKNTVVVAAAGNGGVGSLSYPAAYGSTIAVAATDANRALTWYSQYGPGLDMSAPGGDSSVDANGDGRADGIYQQTFAEGNPLQPVYTAYQGTSMAAPHVSGVAALVRARGTTRARDIIDAIRFSARDLGSPGFDTRYGYGLVNAYGAVRYRPMIAPRFIYPSARTSLPAGRRVVIRWDRRGMTNLRYHLAYSANAGAWRTFSDGFERTAIGPSYAQSGNAGWEVNTVRAASGARSASSGNINDSQVSEMTLTKRVVRATNISFDFSISTERNYDFFDFYIDGRRRLHVSGSSRWRRVTYPVSAGRHTFKWVYTKDYSVSEGLDAVFIDNITLPNVSSAVWRDIVKTTRPGASSYSWTVPNNPGNDYRLRIRAYNGVRYGVWIHSPSRFFVVDL